MDETNQNVRNRILTCWASDRQLSQLLCGVCLFSTSGGILLWFIQAPTFGFILISCSILVSVLICYRCIVEQQSYSRHCGGNECVYTADGLLTFTVAAGGGTRASTLHVEDEHGGEVLYPPTYEDVIKWKREEELEGPRVESHAATEDAESGNNSTSESDLPTYDQVVSAAAAAAATSGH